MRTGLWFTMAAMSAWAGVAPVAAEGNGLIGIFTDLTATQTSAMFAIGVPRTLYIVARLEGETASGIAGAEFRVDGLPAGWMAYVTPAPEANVTLGDPFQTTGVGHRANIAFPYCVPGINERVLLYTVVVVATSEVPPTDLVVEIGDPPSNPAMAGPVLVDCDAPMFTQYVAERGRFHIGVRAPQDLDYSQRAGYDGERGVQPESGLPGDLFHFRASYTSANGLLPAASWPRVELDVNGDGDPDDPGEGAFTMSPSDLDSTLANGKEYRYDAALAAPPGGRYRYRMMALDANGDAVPGLATAWRDSLFVGGDLVDLRVDAEGMRVLPASPVVGASCMIAARIENRSDRQVEDVAVTISDVFGAHILQRTLPFMGPRSATEVATHWRFMDFGFQPVVVRVSPGGASVDCDASNNQASHAVFVGGITVTGHLSVGGLPPLISVPPAAPFGVVGTASYILAGSLPASPVRGARVTVRPQWDSSQTTHTDAAGHFPVDLTAPAEPGTYRLSFTVSDRACRDSTVVSVNVAPVGARMPPHGPNLSIQLTALRGSGCPPGSAAIAWSVENRGDRDSEPTLARLLADGVTTVFEAPVATLAPGATLMLGGLDVPLGASGLQAFTAQVDPASSLLELREDDNVATACVQVQPACLDLALEEMRFTGSRICAGESLGMAVRIVNRGCVAALGSRVALQAGTAEIGSVPLPALAPGEVATVAFSPVFETAAPQDLTLLLDPEGADGADCNDASNGLGACAGVGTCDGPPPSPLPDFSVSACDLSVSDSHPAPGDSVRFRATVRNLGPGDAAAFALVRFDLGGMALGDAVPLGALAAGDARVVESSVSWAADFTPTLLTVSVDPNGHAEGTTFDNSASRTLPYELRPQALPACPPASPSMFSLCAPCVGSPFEVRSVILNAGLFDCDSVRVEFRNVSAGNAMLGTAIAPLVPAGSSCTTPPPPVAAAVVLTQFNNHTIAAVVDPANECPELDETNNTFSRTVTVTCGAAPDLVAVPALPPGPLPVPGDTVRAVEVRVTNRGDVAASAVQARLSLEGVVLCDLEMGDLAPGDSNTVVCTTPWVAAPFCPQRLEACADPLGLIDESDESNNCAVPGGLGGVTDLALFTEGIRATPPNPAPGQQVLIQVGIFSLEGVESTCRVRVEWDRFDNQWSLIDEVPLHLPGGYLYFDDAVSFMWTMPPFDVVQLRFQLVDICPLDRDYWNNEALGTLPWDVPHYTPVTVSDFGVESTPEGVMVRWRSGSPEASFDLERRRDGALGWERLPAPVPLAQEANAARYAILDRDAEPGARLEYRLLLRGTEGVEVLATASVVHSAALPRTLALHPARPNPFRPGGVIEYSVPEPRAVELCVYDAAGRRVAVLRSGLQPAGRHAATWSGRDERGQRAPAGVYFCRLTAGAFVQTQRFVLVH